MRGRFFLRLSPRRLATPLHGEALVRARYRRNIPLLSATEIVWGIGMGFVPFGTVVAFLLKRLGASDVLIGTLATASALMMVLPQLPSVYLSERLRRKIGFFIVAHYPGCLAILGMGATAYAADSLGHDLAAWLIIASVAVFGLSMGAVTPLWIHLMAKLLPARVRNTVWSWIMCAGTAAGLIGTWASHRILGASPDLNGYAICLTLGGLLCLVAIQFFWPILEPEEKECGDHDSFRDFLRTHLRAVRQCPRLLRLLPPRILGAAASAMALAFLSVAAREQFNLPDAHATVFASAAIISQVVHALWAGPVLDRLGSKPLLIASPLLVSTACVLAVLAPSPVWFTLAFALIGGLWLVDLLSFNNLVMKYSPSSDKSPFIAVTSTIVTPFSAISPILGGVLAGSARGYDLVFLAAMVLGVASAVGLAIVVEPDPRPVRGVQKAQRAA